MLNPSMGGVTLSAAKVADSTSCDVLSAHNAIDVQAPLECSRGSNGGDSYRNSGIIGRDVTPLLAQNWHKRSHLEVTVHIDSLRIPPLAPESFSAEQKEVVGPWSVLNFSRVLAHHPALYRVFVPLVEKVIRYTHLPPWDREVLVVRVLAQCGETYEASHHADIAQKVGMTDAQIAAVKTDGVGLSEFDNWLIKAADELVRQYRIGDETWQALSQRYSTVEMMEVVGLVGCYTTMAMVTRSFGIPLEAAQGTSEQLAGLREYT